MAFGKPDTMVAKRGEGWAKQVKRTRRYRLPVME